MPCGCFGGGKKSKARIENELNDSSPLGQSTPTTKLKERSVDDPSKNAKKKDVVASQDGADCALLGFRTTGSRPPSSVVDSPNSNSHTHTPSTAPIAASATSSQNTSVSQSPPPGGRPVATCRAQLVEKRREFFRDFVPGDYKSSPYALSSTLPTASRAQKFGKVRGSRPLSQPHSPESEAPPPPPPGPHLLRPTPVSKGPPKIESDDSGFANPEFLYELRHASEEISRRWAMSDDETSTSPSSLKMRAISPPNAKNRDASLETEHASETTAQNAGFYVDFSTNQINEETRMEHEPLLQLRDDVPLAETNVISRLTPSPEVMLELSQVDRCGPQQPSAALPQTMITPPSPPVNVEDPLFPSSTSPPLRTDPSDASSDEENDVVYNMNLDDDESQAQMVELLSRQNDYDDDEDGDNVCINYDYENNILGEQGRQKDDATTFSIVDVTNLNESFRKEGKVLGEDEDDFNYLVSEDIRQLANNDDDSYLMSAAEFDLLASSTREEHNHNVKVTFDDDVDIILSKDDDTDVEFIPVESEEDQPAAAQNEATIYGRQDIDSPMDDSPSELESLSTDRRKIDPNESIHLHDDGLGSEIDEGSDIIDEQQQLKHQKQHKQSPVSEISSKDKST